MSITCYGWSLAAPTVPLRHRELLSVSDFDLHAAQSPFAGASLCLFTDGSAQHPGDPALRFASWAVVQGTSGGGPADASTLAVGALPGLIQSAYRAELYAVLVAKYARCPCGVTALRLCVGSVVSLLANAPFDPMGNILTFGFKLLS